MRMHVRAMIGLLAGLLAVLTACSSVDNGRAANGPAAMGKHGEQTPLTLRVAWWGGEPRHAYTLRLIDRYTQLHPHVTIEAEYASWDDYWRRLAPEAAANQLPDVMQMDASYITPYGLRNQLADLNAYLDAGIDQGDIPAAYLDSGRIDGQLFGMLSGVNALQLHYDPILLAEAGSVRKLPNHWSWAQYEALAMKMAEQDLFFDTGFKPEVFFAYYLRTRGASLYASDGTSLGYIDDQLFQDFFGMTTRIALAGGAPTPDRTVQVKGIADDFLVLGQAVGIWQWSNQFIGLQQVADRPLAIYPPPESTSGMGLFLKPSMFWSISQNSRHKEEAARFLNFLLHDVEANRLMNGDRGVPASESMRDRLRPDLSAEQLQVFGYIDWLASEGKEMVGPDPIGAVEVMELFKTLDEALKFNQITVEEAAQKFREEANAILARHQ